MSRIATLAALVFATATAGALAAQHTTAPASQASTATAAALSEGEVRKVDREARKVTIKHGPLANLDMPGMTMVFHVKDVAMLERVKAGDAIRFKAEKLGGNYTVVELEKK